MAATTIDEQINSNNEKIRINNAGISQNNASAAAYHKKAVETVCRGTKNQKASCEAERTKDYATEASLLEQSELLKSMNTQLEADNKELIKQRSAESTAIVNLSLLGQTRGSVITIAEGQAKAAQVVAESQAKALELEATTKAETSADDGKAKRNMFIAFGVLFLVVLAIIAFQKIKNSKKPKKSK